MATQVQMRKGTTAQHSTFTGAVAEITVDIDKDTVVVHDGSAAGGHPLLREDLSNITSVPVNKGGTGATTAANARTNLGLGTAATKDTGTGSGQVVVLDGSAKLPAVDGSQLTGIGVGYTGFRNRIINGAGQLSQRGTATALTAGGVYGADRWIHYCSGGTGITATCAADVSGIGGATNRYIYSAGSWTTGTPGFAQRIEAANCYDLNSKSVTVSGKIYQNTGSPLSFNIKLLKANSSDNFGATTSINTISAGSIPSGALTSFSVTFSLGATDAANGLQLAIEAASAITVTSKIIAITDVQLEVGTVATPFEFRPIDRELQACQRYYWKSNTIYGYSPAAAANITWPFKTPVTMRINPTTANVYSSGTLAAGNVRQVGAGTDKAAGIAANSDGGYVLNSAATTGPDTISFIIDLSSEL